MKPFFIWVSIPLEVTVNLPQRKTSKTFDVAENDSIGSVIHKLGFHLDTIVVLCDNKPIPETKKISEDIEITVLEITSKG
jgi:sulfur carrier protein ThiS